ncbi:hypothetical protein B5C34_04930 [Pacificimonas flava]|uniref:O-antigen ligase-related domain-containing protein n=2 Tax=Pacificimonas TaxID=1960290 RepID=A0A219B4Z3_9SPHN|nr:MULTISPECIES: O-antigen ligase family protein [Pacificimonas]MBZ6377439.1 O-antigen ligase family protein [Pacificimonas aurantium]OWV32859.1 hypothetical protein B5C34_04930 [Pacificimonas flava]
MARKLSAALDHFRTSPNVSFYLFAGFLILVFFLGGTSRDDAITLAILRPAAVIALGLAIYRTNRTFISPYVVPLGIFAGLLAIGLIQLIPLPPGLWAALPLRDRLMPGLELLGLDEIWRPISLSPARTWNAVYALTVPLTAILLFSRLTRDRLHRIFELLAALVAASAFLSLMQLLGSRSSPFFLYGPSNTGDPTGIFASRNHNSVLLASGFVFLAALFAEHRRLRRPLAQSAMFLLLAVLFLLMIVAGGSRMGLFLGAGAIFLTPFIVRFDRAERGWMGALASPLIVLGAALFVGLLLVFGAQTAAFDRLFEQSSIDDFRFSLLPVVWDMVKSLFPWGGGLGAFEDVYRMFEPTNLLRDSYVNRAHNDLLEFLFEAGLGAVIVLVAGAYWWLKRAAGSLASGSPTTLRIGLVLSLVWLLASLLEYPVRTPIGSVTFAFALCLVAMPKPVRLRRGR